MKLLLRTCLGNGAGSLTQQSVTSVGSDPVALVAADFNDDGKQDLAVVNSGSNSVSIMLGNGNGTFTAGTTLTGFNEPVAVVAGNFGNGQEDLAVVNKGNNTVSILLGNGNGTFTTGAMLTTGSSPTSIAAADFNNDGKLDLVVTNSASNTVSAFLGNGNGTFGSAVNYAVGSNPVALAAGDLDGDGIPDLVVANQGSNNVSVLIGNGDGTFASAVNYDAGTSPTSVALGDFYGSGPLDITVADQGSNQEMVLLNTGFGLFLPAISIPLPDSPNAVVTGAFFHDGAMNQVVDGPLTLIPRLEDNPPVAVAVAFSPAPNANAMAWMDENGAIVLYKYGLLKKQVQIIDPGGVGGVNNMPHALAISPNGRWLVASRNDTVDVWDLTQPPGSKPVASYTDKGKNGQPIVSLAFDPSQKNPTVYMGNFRGRLTTWTIPAKAPQTINQRVLGIGAVSITSLAISPNGKSQAMTVGTRLRVIVNGGVFQIIRLANRAGNGLVTFTAIAFSPDNKYLAVATDDKTVLVYSLVNPLGPPRIFTGFKGDISSLVYLPDDTLVIGDTTGNISTVSLGVNINDPTKPGAVVLAKPMSSNIGEVAVSPDGKYIGVAGDDTTSKNPLNVQVILSLNGQQALPVPQWTIFVK